MDLLLKNIKMFVLFFLFAFWSCQDQRANKKNADINVLDTSEMLVHKIPDSLRSEDQKILAKKIKEVVFNGLIVKNKRMMFLYSEADLISKGIPSIYYWRLKKDVEDINNLLDTVNDQDINIEQGLLEAKKDILKNF